MDEKEFLFLYFRQPFTLYLPMERVYYLLKILFDNCKNDFSAGQFLRTVSVSRSWNKTFNIDYGNLLYFFILYVYDLFPFSVIPVYDTNVPYEYFPIKNSWMIHDS